MNYFIKDIEYYLPDRIIDNDYLEKVCGIDRQFTESKVGIKERRIASDNESTSDMAFKAAEKIFYKGKISKEEIGLVLVCTQNPDYRLPTTACLVQNKLGLSKSTLAFDINLGCSGYVYSLPIAGNFIVNGIVKNALIIMVDQYSRIIDYKDKNTASIFGDAAAASILSPCEDGYGVLDYNFGTDGSGAELLIAWNSGVVNNPDKQPYIFMDGKEIFKFTMLAIPPSIEELLTRNNVKLDDFKYVIFHQANQYMLKELKKRMKLTDEQIVIDMEYVGNTISATIPIALKNLIVKNRLQKGDLLLLSGFGVGLSWGNIIYRYI
jgi:3-oxoacyl-[acyl-carrier-protein] synthase-3